MYLIEFFRYLLSVLFLFREGDVLLSLVLGWYEVSLFFEFFVDIDFDAVLSDSVVSFIVLYCIFVIFVVVVLCILLYNDF